MTVQIQAADLSTMVAMMGKARAIMTTGKQQTRLSKSIILV